MNRKIVLEAMIEDAKRQSSDLREKANLLDSLIAEWHEQLQEMVEGDSGSKAILSARAMPSRMGREHRTLVGEKQKALQDIIEQVMMLEKRPLKTVEIKRAMAEKGNPLTSNYVGTLLSRGKQFTLLTGGRWILQPELAKNAESVENQSLAIDGLEERAE